MYIQKHTFSGSVRFGGKVGKLGSLGTVMVGQGKSVVGKGTVELEVSPPGVLTVEVSDPSVEEGGCSVEGAGEAVVGEGVMGVVTVVGRVVAKVEIVSSLSKASCNSSSKFDFSTAKTIVETQKAVVAKAKNIAKFLAVRTEIYKK